MARIRTIKPEFWTSEKVVECSRDARLLFIGLWNFSDDHGIHPDSVKRIKMEIFPGDFDIDAESIRRMIDELSIHCLIRRYSVDGEDFLKVEGWDKHQKIDRPTYRFPLPIDDECTCLQEPLDEHSTSDHPRKGMEGNGREWKGMDLSTPHGVDVTFPPDGNADQPPDDENDNAKPDRIPVQQVVDLYHELLPELPKVQKLTEARRGYIRQRWREDLPDLSHWRNFFNHIRKSDFLMGKSPGANGKPPFVADLEWLTKPANFAKIAEDKYHRPLRAVR
ncbi:MAG: hypothetical protein KDJ39_06005 [Gammaproteobacteria bacterium]|nr:hypothetical protein [Gammaproteobacteria bacterium]